MEHEKASSRGGVPAHLDQLPVNSRALFPTYQQPFQNLRGIFEGLVSGVFILAPLDGRQHLSNQKGLRREILGIEQAAALSGAGLIVDADVRLDNGRVLYEVTEIRIVQNDQPIHRGVEISCKLRLVSCEYIFRRLRSEA